MNKGPLVAVIVSIIAVVGIYFFLDIKPNQKNIIEDASPSIVTEQSDFIAAFNETLNPETRAKVHNWLAKAKENDSLSLDSLISFYEKFEQFNFSAYYHTLKAELSNTSKSWELAGDRQLSVSQNNAYDSVFNQLLLNKSIASYENALRLDSTNLNIQTKLGEAYMLAPDQPMQGITMLLKVIEQDSMHVNANLALGKFGIVSGQYDKALIRLEKVLSLQPENTEALLLAAEVETYLGNIESAKEKLELCVTLVEDEDLKKDINAFLKRLK